MLQLTQVRSLSLDTLLERVGTLYRREKRKLKSDNPTVLNDCSANWKALQSRVLKVCLRPLLSCLRKKNDAEAPDN